MSDSGDTMGSLLEAAAPAAEDVDPEAPSVSIEIDGGAASTTSSQDTAAVSRADLLALEERVSTLLHVHSDEFRAVETRVAQLEQLKMAELMAQAAASVSAAAADCAKAAAMASETMRAATEVLDFVSNSDYIQGEIESHARNAAIAIRDTVINASSEAAAAVSADVKKATGRKR